jgi:hypothetical protein
MATTGTSFALSYETADNLIIKMFTVLTSLFYLIWKLNLQLKDHPTGRLLTCRNLKFSRWSISTGVVRVKHSIETVNIIDASSFRAFILFPHFVYDYEEGNNMFFQNVGNSYYCNVYLVLKQLFTFCHDLDVNLFAFLTIPLAHYCTILFLHPLACVWQYETQLLVCSTTRRPARSPQPAAIPIEPSRLLFIIIVKKKVKLSLCLTN